MKFVTNGECLYVEINGELEFVCDCSEGLDKTTYSIINAIDSIPVNIETKWRRNNNELFSNQRN